MLVLTIRSVIVPLLTLIVGMGSGTAIAQSLDKEPKRPASRQEQAQVIENLEPGLWLEPSYGVQFTTGPGAGYESSFGTVYGWVPFGQDGFEKLFYTEAQARFEADSDRWGGNWAVGYRNFASEFIWGGYLSYDLQDVGTWTAHQIGLGFEALHPQWEARLNGYLPVGNRSTTLGSSSTVVDQSFTNARFSGSNLLVTPQNTVRQDITEQGSLMGVDLEGGMMLESWPGGQLKGFAGTYVYGGPGTDTFVGVRTRLLAEMNNFNFGAALSSDRLFGTNLTFTIGATFGGGARSAQEDAIVALLSKPLTRQKNIATHTYTESTFTTTTEAEVTALNPNSPTNEPWQFETVDLDAGETIATGLSNAQANGADIVYVQGQGTEGGFEVPSNVRVLSSGPVQTLPVSSGSFTGTATLPNSGSGNYPSITSDITFAATQDQGTEFSGFALTGGAGMQLSEVTGTVDINNNQINGADSRGIYFVNNSGTLDLTISGNTITNTTDDAIRGDTTGTSIVTVTISNNTINQTTSVNPALINSEGIDLEVYQSGQLTAIISGNRITAADNSGIELEAQEDDSVLNATVTGNTISDSGGDGILVLHDSNRDLTITISDNTITNSGTNNSGITKTIAPVVSMGVLIPAVVDVGEGGFGIGVMTLANGNLDLTIIGNTITKSTDAKIGVAVNPSFLFVSQTVTPSSAASDVSNEFIGNSRVDATIRLNTMTDSGIGLDNLTSAGLSDYNTGSFGALVGDSGTLCLNLENNTAAEVGSTTTSGYQFVQNGGASTLTLGTNSGNTGSFVTTEGTVGSGTCN